MDRDVFARSIGKDLERLELAGHLIDSDDLTLEDEAADSLASNLRYKSDEIRVLLGHDFQMSRKDADLAALVTMDLRALPVILELACEVASLQLREHLAKISSYPTEHGSKGYMHGHSTSNKQLIIDTNLEQRRYEIVVVGPSCKARFHEFLAMRVGLGEILFAQFP